MNTRFRKETAVLLAVGAVLVGCATGSTTQTAGSGSGTASATAATAQPTTSVTQTPTGSPAASAPVLADGRYPARIVAIDAARRVVTVDVVQLFMGKAAASAAAADHATEVPPPNDYWIRNTSPLLRRYYVTSTAPITVNDLGAVITQSATKNVAVSLSWLAKVNHLSDSVFWVTVEHQVVTRIAEQYLP